MTNADPAKPADTLTMTLFHSALRRDLERTRILLEASDELSLRGQRRLGRHLLWMMGNLRWHHEGEDHYLWPILLEREPESASVLDAMEAEHHAIDEPLLWLEACARGLVASRTEPHDVIDALNALEKPLLEHLAHEEGGGMEIVSRVLDHQEWKEFEQRAWIDGYTVQESIRFAAWIVDGVEWNTSIRRRMGLSGPVHWAVVKPLSSLARVPALSIWAGTPAARIGSEIA